ncbi:MAG: putative signal transducing protein [Flavobacteriales bacterium]
MKGWVLVTRCPDATMAPLIQGGLEAEGVPCVIMNKQDSSYVGMCFAVRPVEIWVPEAHAAAAEAWLNTKGE